MQIQQCGNVEKSERENILQMNICSQIGWFRIFSSAESFHCIRNHIDAAGTAIYNFID